MNLRHSQKGLTFAGMVFNLSLGIFFVFLALKIGPMYAEHVTIRTVMESVKSHPDLATSTRDMIIDMLHKRLEINNVNSLKPQDITVVKRGSYLRVQIAYDRVAPLVGNLDAVAHFDDAFEVGSE